MSTATLNSLLEYLYGTLTPSNMRWVGEHLIEHAYRQESEKPYTMEEINARIDKAERESAAGLGIDGEDMFRGFEDEFAREEIAMAEAV